MKNWVGFLCILLVRLMTAQGNMKNWVDFLWIQLLRLMPAAQANLKNWVNFFWIQLMRLMVAQPILTTAAVWLLIFVIRRQRRQECYLVDFACYKPPAERQANMETSLYVNLKMEPIIPERSRFQWRLLLRSGLGEETSLSRLIFSDENVQILEEASVEMEESFISTADELFAKTSVSPQEIDILIVTVSTFTTAPSHAAVVANHYKMKESVRTFNLSGMGCSTGTLAVDMAKDLLLVNPNSYVLILCSESTAVNGNYPGKDKNFRLADCLFRVGGAAMLLSNKPGDASRAKLRLLHTVRSNEAADDEAYDAVFITEDDDGVYGVRLFPTLLNVATKAVRQNLFRLGPRVLPLHEQLRYAANWIQIKVLKVNVEPYVPDFKKAFEQVCVHPGGRSVVEGVGKALRLSEYDLEPSRMALFRFGNTSSSGIWYELAYMQAKRRLKVGQRVLQIGLGSGFKCNTAVWEVLRKMEQCESSCWDDCIHRYPCDTRLNYGNDFCDRWLFRPETTTT